MKRSARKLLAEQTVEITNRGSYELETGQVVRIKDEVQACLKSTRFFTPEQLDKFRQDILNTSASNSETTIEVENETTLTGIDTLLKANIGPVAVLNFASAKNPGGGFLNGSQAQEESLARSSALYESLRQAPKYYEEHRAASSSLYSDRMILSPNCPIFRDDAGNLLAQPHLATFITSPAPNAGAVAKNAPEDISTIPEVLTRRSEYILALAASEGYGNLILGAWGCGVFQNDPKMVAETFSKHLKGAWAGRFQRVRFSVLDTSIDQLIIQAFQETLNA